MLSLATNPIRRLLAWSDLDRASIEEVRDNGTARGLSAALNFGNATLEATCLLPTADLAEFGGYVNIGYGALKAVGGAVVLCKGDFDAGIMLLKSALPSLALGVWVTCDPTSDTAFKVAAFSALMNTAQAVNMCLPTWIRKPKPRELVVAYGAG